MLDFAEKALIKKNVEEILSFLPSDVTLLAASKGASVEKINYAAECGVKVIGENRVDELLSKYDGIDKSKLDIHFIGHLQTNKVKYIIDKVSLIHSVDSEHLAEEISKRAGKIGKVMRVLVEVNIGGETSKSGIAPEETAEFVEKIAALPNISVCGLMCIPPKSDSEEKNSAFFKKIKQIFIDISGKKVDNINMGILSMGMSSDWKTAVECGSTMIRVGSGIFGARYYPPVSQAD